jgi:hypothetical protein
MFSEESECSCALVSADSISTVSVIRGLTADKTKLQNTKRGRIRNMVKSSSINVPST